MVHAGHGRGADICTSGLAQGLATRPAIVCGGQGLLLAGAVGVFPSQAATELVRNELQRSESMQAQQAATVVAVGSL